MCFQKAEKQEKQCELRKQLASNRKKIHGQTCQRGTLSDTAEPGDFKEERGHMFKFSGATSFPMWHFCPQCIYQMQQPHVKDDLREGREE